MKPTDAAPFCADAVADRAAHPLVSRHRSDVVGCAQPSERNARRIVRPIPSVLASDATPRCASMASADRQMIGDATLGYWVWLGPYPLAMQSPESTGRAVIGPRPNAAPAILRPTVCAAEPPRAPRSRIFSRSGRTYAWHPRHRRQPPVAVARVIAGSSAAAPAHATAWPPGVPRATR